MATYFRTPTATRWVDHCHGALVPGDEVFIVNKECVLEYDSRGRPRTGTTGLYYGYETAMDGCSLRGRARADCGELVTARVLFNYEDVPEVDWGAALADLLARGALSSVGEINLSAGPLEVRFSRAGLYRVYGIDNYIRSLLNPSEEFEAGTVYRVRYHNAFHARGSFGGLAWPMLTIGAMIEDKAARTAAIQEAIVENRITPVGEIKSGKLLLAPEALREIEKEAIGNLEDNAINGFEYLFEMLDDDAPKDGISLKVVE